MNDFVLNQNVVMSNVRNDGVETKGNSRNLVVALLAAEAYIHYYKIGYHWRFKTDKKQHLLSDFW